MYLWWEPTGVTRLERFMMLLKWYRFWRNTMLIIFRLINVSYLWLRVRMEAAKWFPIILVDWWIEMS